MQNVISAREIIGNGTCALVAGIVREVSAVWTYLFPTCTTQLDRTTRHRTNELDAPSCIMSVVLGAADIYTPQSAPSPAYSDHNRDGYELPSEDMSAAVKRDKTRTASAKRRATMQRKIAAQIVAAPVAAFVADAYPLEGGDATYPADAPGMTAHAAVAALTNGKNRREIQALAKAHGVKANLSTKDILAQLVGRV